MSPVINKIVIMHFECSGEKIHSIDEDRPGAARSTLGAAREDRVPFGSALNYRGFSRPAVGGLDRVYCL